MSYPSQKTIAIMTDFGLQDPFVGIMKGVIINISPSTTMIDITHSIHPGDIFQGAIVLWRAVHYFPKDTIFLAVVDPGVGSNRHPILLKTRDYHFVGPDNGLFSYVTTTPHDAWLLNQPFYFLNQKMNTFDGRDIFAPVAAHLSNGLPADKIGEKIESIVRLNDPGLEVFEDHIMGETLYPDQFGNILTSIGKFRMEGDTWRLTPWGFEAEQSHTRMELRYAILSNGVELPVVKTFSDLPRGRCGVLVGSSGLLEIVANQASAQKILNLERQNKITLMITKSAKES